MDGSGLREREEGRMWSRNLKFGGMVGSSKPSSERDQVCSWHSGQNVAFGFKWS